MDVETIAMATHVMRATAVLALVAGLVGASRSSRPSAKTGVDKLAHLQAAIINGLVPFSSTNYSEYAIAGDRPYHLFLMLTAVDAKYKCALCQVVEPEFALLAASAPATDPAGLGILFGVVDFDLNQPAFAMHGFSSAPQLVYMPPNHTQSQRRVTTPPVALLLPSSNIYRMERHDKQATSERFLDFVKIKTGIQAVIQRPQTTRLIFVAACALLVALIVVALVTNTRAAIARLRRKRLWLAVSLMFYGMSVSGMLHCIIRDPPNYVQDRSGAITWVHPNARVQFVAEGLVVGALDLGAAGCLIALTQVSVFVKSRTWRYVALLASVGGFVVLYKQMVAMYAVKNSWYRVNII